MTTTPGSASSNLPGKPPVVDLATWQAAREELLVREKAHTREGDAIAAARRRLPMVEVAAGLPLTGPDGPLTLLGAAVAAADAATDTDAALEPGEGDGADEAEGQGHGGRRGADGGAGGEGGREGGG